jgi:hypothetical protein
MSPREVIIRRVAPKFIKALPVIIFKGTPDE